MMTFFGGGIGEGRDTAVMLSSMNKKWNFLSLSMAFFKANLKHIETAVPEPKW